MTIVDEYKQEADDVVKEVSPEVEGSQSHSDPVSTSLVSQPHGASNCASCSSLKDMEDRIMQRTAELVVQSTDRVIAAFSRCKLAKK